MSDSERFDGIIIGTGQAGKPLAGALAAAGWRVAVIERSRVGGTCVINGCTPTKAMVASARVAHMARRANEYGVHAGRVEVDLEAVRERKRGIVDMFSTGSERGLRRHDRLELIFGDATFLAPRELEIRLTSGGTRRLTAQKIFINTGTRPRIPPVPGLDSVRFLDSTSIMEMGRVPEHLLVLGGGFIGLEFAQMFRRFGARVTVIEQGPRLAGREDDDVADAIEEILVEDGVSVRTSTTVTRVGRAEDGGVSVCIRSGRDDDLICGSELLVAAGRTPNTDSLGMAAAGLETDARGYVMVNEFLETGTTGVYALGDVAGSPPFTHIAYDDYRIVRGRLLGEQSRGTRGRLVPYTVFIDPQLGRVGVTEREARQTGRQIRIAKLPMTGVARAIETGETRGFMKAVVDARTDRILGAAILGMEGGEIASALQIAMMGDLPYTAVRDGVFAHPTIAESLNNLFMSMDAQ